MFNMAATLFEMKCVSDCVSNNAYTTRLSSLDLWLTTTGKIIVVAWLRVLVPPNSALPLLRKLVADDESAAPDTAASQLPVFTDDESASTCTVALPCEVPTDDESADRGTAALLRKPAADDESAAANANANGGSHIIIVQQRWVPFCAYGTSVSGPTWLTAMTET